MCVSKDFKFLNQEAMIVVGVFRLPQTKLQGSRPLYLLNLPVQIDLAETVSNEW